MKYRIVTICLALILLLAPAVVETGPRGAHAQQANRVGLVVEHGDGSVTTRCIEFSEQEISGYDVLTRSGLNVVAAFESGMGAAVCAVGGEGCPAESCLTCDVPNYWAYWHLDGGAWVYSPIGVSSYTVHDGDVEGWRWGGGDPPDVIQFDQICAPPPTDTPAPPTDTPPPPTDTPAPPTDTSTPEAATDTPPPPTPVVWFRLDENPIAAGACTMVRWDTTNAHEVYLDGESVGLNGSREACPSAAQEYHLRVASAAGEQTHTLVLGVTGALPSPSSTPLPVSQPAAGLSSSVSPTPGLTVIPSSPPSPSPTPQSVAAVSPPSTPARVMSLSSPTLTPHVTQPLPTPTGLDAARSATGEQPAAPNGERTASALVPIGYIVFSLIGGGLGGWLIFFIRQK